MTSSMTFARDKVGGLRMAHSNGGAPLQLMSMLSLPSMVRTGALAGYVTVAKEM